MKKDLRLKMIHDRARRRFFPHHQTIQIKAVACEMPAKHEQPLSRLFVPDIQRIVVAEKIVPSISCATIWRMLDADALKPWKHHWWKFIRDPYFYERAAPALDLYEGFWKRKPLGKNDYVISADEKTGIQALCRLRPTEICCDNRGQRVEHEYVRKSVWAYLAALDIRGGKVFGRVELTTGVEPFMRLVDQVMTREPYASARRVFWIVDRGPSHHPNTFPARLMEKYRRAIAVLLPVHGSWVNQIETYFSIVERKALTPKDFSGRDEARRRIIEFQKLYTKTAYPFEWRYTRYDLRKLLKKLEREKCQKDYLTLGTAV